MKTPEPGHVYALAGLLPHGPGFLLLDELLDYGADHASCAVRITPQARFFEPGRGVPAWVGVEYMAQAIGAYAGIVRLQSGLAVEIGLLLGTRRYRCAVPYFAEGATLVARAEQLVRDASGVAAFACTLSDDSRELARAEIKAFQPDDIHDYLQTLTENPA